MTTVDDYGTVILIDDPDNDLGKRRKTSTSVDSDGKTRSEPTAEELTDRAYLSCLRARRNLKFKILAAQCDRLFTLTKRDRIPTLRDAWDLWSKFEKEYSRLVPYFKCIMVPEPHKLGGWHIHFTTNRFYDVSRMRLVWHRVLTGKSLLECRYGEESPGNVDASRHANSKKKIAGYLGKYVTKSFGEVLTCTQKRYACSKGLPNPEVKNFRLPRCAGGEAYHLRQRLSETGWHIQRLFEGYVNHRRLLWVEVRRSKAAASPRGVPYGALDQGGPSAYS
jgi:hypothetical protein